MSTVYRIHFNDEATKIGSGHRLVIVMRGRKYVRLFCPSTLVSQRILRSVWERIEASKSCREATDVKPSKVAKRIRAQRSKIAEWNEKRKMNNEFVRRFDKEAKGDSMMFDGGKNAKEALASLR